MGYKKEIYEKALKIKKDKAKSDELLYNRSIEALRNTDNEFRTIESELSKAGSRIALAAFAGNEAELKELKEFCDKKNNRKHEILTAAGIKKPVCECSLCDDSGYSHGKLCECVNNIARRLAFEELSKNMPLDDCRFDTFDLNFYSDKADASDSVPRRRAASVLKLCQSFTENFPNDVRSILFMGDAGLGKTHLSLAIVSEISNKGYGVIYGSAQKLFGDAEKEHFSFGGETSVVDSLIDCDLLVIDDLGTEFYSSFAASLFYNIVNSRILNRKPTVINTNLSFDELEKRYTPRITSRFIGNYDMKKLIGNDIRQIKAAK